MTSRKRPKLCDRGDSSRGGSREAVRIPGTCQVGDRPAEDVFVTDIDERGCRLRLVTIGVTKALPVVLRMGGEEPIVGRLKWIKQASIGVAFDPPVAADVLERLVGLVPDNVVSLRRAPLH